MDLKRGMAGDNVLWKVEGSFDDESVLRFETMVLNSEYHGEDLVIDLRETRDITTKGLRSLDRVVHEVKTKGASVKVLPPEEPVDKEIKRILKD
jgi:anti-anti-sigma regulatory factor